MTGSATGSFVRGPINFNNDGRPVSGSTPQGMIGNWGVGSAPVQRNRHLRWLRQQQVR
jgi:hypothetical protein